MNTESISLNMLKQVSGLKGLALLLGVKASWLSYVLYVMQPADKYKNFDIPKKKGGKRTISAPEPGLKSIQKKVANLLSDIEYELELPYRIDGLPSLSFDEKSVRYKSNTVVSHGFKKSYLL